LAGFATCEATRQTLRQLAPKKSAAEARQSFQEIQQTSTIVLRGVRPHMESLDLFPAWFQRLSRNAVLKTLELRDVRHFCLEALV
jgi:DNA mismatch repair protein MutS2